MSSTEIADISLGSLFSDSDMAGSNDHLSELTLYKQYLATLADITHLLLENASEQNWAEVLQLLAEITRTGNCTLFLNEIDESGQLCARLRSTWPRPGSVNEVADSSPLRDLRYEDYPTLNDTLHAGMVLARDLTDLPPAEYSLFSRQNISSVLCVPLLVGGELEGFIGLFCQHEKRAWLPLEINALCGIANGLALAVARKRMEQTLRTSETRLRALVGATEDIVIEFNSKGIILNLWADSASRLLPSKTSIIGQSLEQALPGPMAQAISQALTRVLGIGQRDTIKFTLPCEGGDRYFLGRLQSLPAESGTSRNLIALVRDATDLMQEEAEQRTMLETLDLLDEAVVDMSLDGRLTSVSAAWEKLLGSGDDPRGQPLLRYVHSDDSALLDSAIAMLASSNKNTETIRFRMEQPDSTHIWIEARLLAHRSPDGHATSLRGILRDITQSYLQEKRIKQLALHDALTELPNRILLEEHLNQAIARAQRNAGKVALGFIDLDHFKHINDTLGHKAGDTVLVTLSRRLQGVLREIDTLSRWGGDEFVVLLPDAESEYDIRGVAERLREAARQSIDIDGIATKLTLSIGFAIYPDDADSAEGLMSVADHTMFHAKNVGRNNVQFFRDIHDKGLDRKNVLLQANLNRAVQDRLLQVFYQPVIDTSNGQIVVFEALARWHDEQAGWIAPDVFIPMAEHLGIIHELGQQVFDHALERLSVWREKGFGVKLAVNISRTQLFAPNFVGELQEKLAVYHLTPQDIILEITETVALLDVTYESKRLNELAQCGFTIAIDDFGTGHSALSQLHQMPIHMLKIDASFTSRLDTDDGRRIVQAIVQMADALRLEMVVEGVETLEAANYLKGLGVAQMQGFLFSDAVPAGLCEILMEQSSSAFRQSVFGD
jgi:diguanylate cyclase (GGDEF)-like protein/PAS domain S-box-containing protein